MKDKDLIECFLDNAANSNKGVTIIKSDTIEEFISYNKIYKNACRYLRVFREKGVVQGNEILYQIEDIEKGIYIFWACQLGGITAVPLDIGENDENNIKVFRIWSVLDKAYYLSDEDNMEVLRTYIDSENSVYLNEMTDKFISLNILDEYEDNGSDCELNNSMKEDRIALIQFSSGSTGIPKGIPIKYNSLYTHVNALAKREEITSNDATLNWAPLSHNLGLVSVHLVSTLMGISQYIMSKKLFVNNPVLWIDKASEHKVSMIYSPNFGFKHFLNANNESIGRNWNLSNIRIVFNGAEPINVELCKLFLSKLKKYGLKQNVMYPAYGCSESTSVISIPKVGEGLKLYEVNREKLIYGKKVEIQTSDKVDNSIALVGVGYPIDNCEIRVCDKNNNVLEDFQVGDLQVRGTNVISSYYNNEQATKSSFLEDGWFITGDLCFRDKDEIIITGRAKEIIFINGQNYYPYDIERIAEKADSSLSGNTAACGVFNKNLQTDEIYIFVKYDINAGIKEFLVLAKKIKSYISNKLGLYVGKVIPIPKLEKTDSGKLQRLKIQQNYLDGQYSDILNKIDEFLTKNKSVKVEKNLYDEVQSNLLRIWKETLMSDDIGIDDNFFDRGGSSNLLIVMTTKLDELYEDCVSVTDIFEADTIRELTKLIVDSIESKNKVIKLLGNKLPNSFMNYSSDLKSEERFELLNISLKKYPYFYNSDTEKVSNIIFSIYAQLLGNICGNEPIGINLLNKKGNALNMEYLNIKDFVSLEDLINRVNLLGKENNKIDISRINNNIQIDKVVTIFSLQEAEEISSSFKFDIFMWISSIEKSINIKINRQKINISTFKKFVNKFTQAIGIVEHEYKTMK
ncbi:non-ribosomal peptide synthetase [Clostridium felsineum]|uniref:non-ribosomal peptide synthetase n=1 Tax=Clostridium felsineum TaxID=36839 RepID=UPI00098C3BE6|nr:non-ribosomal peptide synthetase [Clostridium felsineum]URZ16785.1 2-succinylbenzoate--CoA ligase [Clostridium felsineum DSM 794]